MFWPDGTQERDLALPLLRETFQFCREVYWGVLALVFLFIPFLFNPYEESIAKTVGLVMLVLVPPTCFFSLYCGCSRAAATSVAMGGDIGDSHNDDLSMPLMTPPTTSDDATTGIDDDAMPSGNESQYTTPLMTPPTRSDDATIFLAGARKNWFAI
jgi:hypothetical protein